MTSSTAELGAAMAAALPRVWCVTCEHEHIATMPAHTWKCGQCGFGSHSSYVAAGHALRFPQHEVRAVFHQMLAEKPTDPLEGLSDEELHERRAHPDYEYVTTTSPRKSGISIRPQGEGWEPNPRGVVYRWANEAGEIVEQGTGSWERFEHHEEEYWMRRRTS